MIVILAQSKKNLVDASEIAIDEFGQIIIFPGRTKVASYPSPSRCLEVLEEIRQACSRGDKTYEMPQV